MTIASYDLSRDVITTDVLTKTNYEITSATAAQERNINSFVMEAGSTGFLVNAKGKILSQDQRNKLKGYASIIAMNWQKVLAEATFKYAGSVYKDMRALKTIIAANGDSTKALKNYT